MSSVKLESSPGLDTQALIDAECTSWFQRFAESVERFSVKEMARYSSLVDATSPQIRDVLELYDEPMAVLRAAADLVKADTSINYAEGVKTAKELHDLAIKVMLKATPLDSLVVTYSLYGRTKTAEGNTETKTGSIAEAIGAIKVKTITDLEHLGRLALLTEGKISIPKEYVLPTSHSICGVIAGEEALRQSKEMSLQERGRFVKEAIQSRIELEKSGYYKMIAPLSGLLAPLVESGGVSRSALEVAMLEIHKSDKLIGWKVGAKFLEDVAALADPRYRGKGHQVEPVCGAHRPILSFVEVLKEHGETLGLLRNLEDRFARDKARHGGATAGIAEERIAIGKELRGKLSGYIAEVACVNELLKNPRIKVLEIGAREFRGERYVRLNARGKTARGEIDVVYEALDNKGNRQVVFGEIKLTTGTAVKKDRGAGDGGQLSGLQKFANQFGADAMLIIWGERDYMHNKEEFVLTRRQIASSTGASPGLLMRDLPEGPLAVAIPAERMVKAN